MGVPVGEKTLGPATGACIDYVNIRNPGIFQQSDVEPCNIRKAVLHVFFAKLASDSLAYGADKGLVDTVAAFSDAGTDGGGDILGLCAA